MNLYYFFKESVIKPGKPVNDMNTEEFNEIMEKFESYLKEAVELSATCRFEIAHQLWIGYSQAKNPNITKANVYKQIALGGEYPLTQYEEGLEQYAKLSGRHCPASDWEYTIECFEKAAMIAPHNNPSRDLVMEDGIVRKGNQVASHKMLANIYTQLSDYVKAEHHYRSALKSIDTPCFDVLIAFGKFLLKKDVFQSDNSPAALAAEYAREEEGRDMLMEALRQYSALGREIFLGLGPQPKEFYDSHCKEAHIQLFDYYKGSGGYCGHPGRAGDLRKCAKHYREAKALGFYESMYPDGFCILTHPVIMMRANAIELADDRDLSDIEY